MSKAKVAIGAVFAAAAGFVAGILTAPKSGKETQADIHDAANTAKNTAAAKAKEVKAKAEAVIEDVKEKVEEVSEDVSEKAADFKERSKRAAESAKKEFTKQPADKKKK